jgi:putative ABC transport system permease protein
VNVREAMGTGLVEIFSHKLRSFLSLSAIMFGVAAILYTFANVNRMYERRETALNLSGPGRITINHQSVKGEDEAAGMSKGLTFADSKAIRAALPWVHMVSPILESRSSIQYGTLNERVRMQGITEEWRLRNWVYTLKGRFFNAHDIETAARVCVLNEPGAWSEEKPYWARWWKDNPFQLFVKHTDILGRTVRIDDQLYTVIGIIRDPPKDKDPRWFRWGNAQVYLPITTMQRYHSTIKRGGQIVPDAIARLIIDTGKTSTIPQAKRRIENLLKARHRGVKDYKLEDFREMIQNMLNRMRQQAIAVLSVGIVAILAGGVGIMNVTLATIFSRVREIGIRRAIGATRGDILFQFITEAMMLGFFGGVAGLALGLAGLNWLAEDGEEVIEALLWWHFLATLGISTAAGLIFSLYPAYHASRLDPVESLRHE